MNVIIYKSLFHNNEWNSNEKIHNLLINTFNIENITIKNILFSSFLYNINSTIFPDETTKRMPFNKRKILHFFSMIWKNPFLNNLQKEEFLSFFCKIQKTYNGFVRFVKLYKYKHATISVNKDLFLNNLDPTNKYTCVFFIHKSIYYFHVMDIWTLLEKGWTNHSNFCLELYTPKNPYTNILFSKTELYNYYFHMKLSRLKIPLLLEFMYQEHFELQNFEIKYETFILKTIIRKIVFESPSNNVILYNNIMEMIDENIYTNRWNIHRDFPKDKLVEIMRNYVYLYYLLLYGKLTDNQIIFISSFLHNSLYLFWKSNPNFGNKIESSSIIPLLKNIKKSSILFDNNIVFESSNIIKPFISFNDKYLKIKTCHL
jgi:hypothetical protein